MDKRAMRTAAAIAAAFCAVGLLASYKERSEDTAADGYLMREGPDGRAYEEELEVTVDGQRESVTVEVEPRSYTEEEAETYLEEAAGRVRTLLETSAETAVRDPQTDNSPAPGSVEKSRSSVGRDGKVEVPPNPMGPYSDGEAPTGIGRLIIMHDLALPQSFEDLPVTCEWLTDNSQVLSYEGKIGPEAKEAGTPAELQGVLSCGFRSMTISFTLTVFPPDPSERPFAEQVAEAVAEANRQVDEGTDRWYLPSQIGDKEVSWRTNTLRSGVTIGALGLIAAVLYLYAGERRKEQLRKRHRDSLLRDYPHIVSKLVLLLGAGLSMRRAFAVMTEDHRRLPRAERLKSSGFEAVAMMCADMDRGILEADAYRRLGQSCDLPLYRSLSVLLVQNLKRGSRELIDMLEREAVSAFEERKKEARILGEQASAKLLAPMMLMLLIVFVIVMVPAFIAF